MTNDTLSLADELTAALESAIKRLETIQETHPEIALDADLEYYRRALRTPTPDTRVEALRPILADMAQQHLIAEMDDPDGDYEFAYECMVKNARKALALLDTPKAPVTDASGEGVEYWPPNTPLNNMAVALAKVFDDQEIEDGRTGGAVTAYCAGHGGCIDFWNRMATVALRSHTPAPAALKGENHGNG